MGKLRDQMLLDLQLSGAKPSTQRAYLREAESLAKYFNKSPEQLGEDELKAYLLHLVKERHLSGGTFREGYLLSFRHSTSPDTSVSSSLSTFVS